MTINDNEEGLYQNIEIVEPSLVEICRIIDKPKHWVLKFRNGTIVVIPKEE